tara:strand:- start:2818 stop:3378 length:561 start_codon:yes stop_codon:yes gene_type:complete
MSKFITPKCTVTFAYLNKPDDKFGEDTANFNVSVEMTDELASLVKKAANDLGAKKVNGVSEYNGVKTIKFKNRYMVKEGIPSFPCVDATTKPTKATAASGDVVILAVSPRKISRDDSLSIYLDGVQIVEKNSAYGTGQANAGFAVQEGGYATEDTVSSAGSAFEPSHEETSTQATEVNDTSDDLPF